MYTLDYDDKDPGKAYLQLSNMLAEHPNIKILIGSSLGAFLILTHNTSILKIAINPCYLPSVELPKINVPINVYRSWGEYESLLTSPHPQNMCLGFFGDQDELLENKYKEQFEKDFNTSGITIPSTHVVTEEAVKQIASILKFYRI